jgi:hypothetical protein
MPVVDGGPRCRNKSVRPSLRTTQYRVHPIIFVARGRDKKSKSNIPSLHTFETSLLTSSWSVSFCLEYPQLELVERHVGKYQLTSSSQGQVDDSNQ